MPAKLDEGPPPSTYAAQIVHNLENARERSQLSGSKTQLAQLFRAVLALDTNDLTDDETFETNLAINHRLIWTIIKGCLCLQGTANPFDNQGAIIELARDGLAVIQVTVRRYPEVAFTSLAKDSAYAAPDGPLFVWVVPRLMTLLHHNNEPAVRDGARDLLGRMLEIKSPLRIVKFRKQPILTYLQHCVDDILDCLIQSDLLHTTDTIFNLPVIPSMTTIREICREDVLKVISRVEADSPVQALSISISCLQIVIDFLGALRSSSAGLLFQRWVVRCLIISRPFLARFAADSQEGNDLFSLFLEVTNASLVYLNQSIQDSTERRQLQQVLCQTVADVFKPVEQNQQLNLSPLLQYTLCSSLHLLCLRMTYDMEIWRTYKRYLDNRIQLVLEEHVLCTFEEDLQVILRFTYRSATGAMDDFPMHDLESCSEAMRDKLKQLFNEKSRQRQETTSTPPSKRLRILEAPSLLPLIISSDFRTIYLEAVDMPQDTSTSLPQVISETLAELPKAAQRDVIIAAGIEACRLSNSIVNGECQTCHGDDINQHELKSKLMDPVQSTQLNDILVCIIRIVQEQKSPSPRVQAMLALRRFLAHCGNTEYIDLRMSTLAAWPLQSLKSSIRSLRIASISAIVHLVSSPTSQTVLRANRVSTLDILRQLSEKDVTLQEISVIAHGRIASIVHSEDEINLCLLRLVEFLGHRNSFVANLAYEELQQLSSHNTNAAIRLFEPYWRTVATVIVKDLRNRPQICQMVCELLGISISHFLKLTQFHTIPFLILRKQSEVLHRIAEANGPGTRLLEICSNSEQLAVILASILMQPSEDPEETIKSLLSQVSEDFSDIKPQELLLSDPIRIAFELLQIASSDRAETKTRARYGIQVLAEKVQRKPHRKFSAVEIFFDENSLGIVQLLSEVVSQTKGAQPTGNRRRCVGAIEEMAIIAGPHALNALPQISACLQSAIEDGDLCNEAFRTWMTLMNSIDSEDEIGTMVEPTFAIVAQHWDLFSTEIQRAAHDLINALIKNRSEWIKDNVLSIPSLEGIPLLAKFESELNNIREKTDPRSRLEAFCDRCRNDNGTVVMQAMKELPTYLLEIQPFIYNSVLSEQPDPSIGYLIKVLLDVCIRFTSKKVDIACEAARCLGLIGCLDPAKIELPHSAREIFVLSDFVNPDETLEFAVFFLEEVLVKTFLAETDTRAQGLLAYAIQELLKTCGFEPRNTINKNLQPDHLYQRWRNIDEGVKETLIPFLTSKYVLEPLVNPPDCSYPIYSTGMNHSIWLRQIVFDLLGKSVGKNAQIIFSICRRIVRRQNIAVSSFLLPFVTLHIIFQGTAEQVEQLSKEFLAILSTPLPIDQPANENLILCSQDVFRTLDYMSRWLQERKKTKTYWPRVGVTSLEEAQQQEMSKLEPIEKFLNIIPAEIVSDRAVQCKNFSRAILHWEAHIRERRKEELVSQEDMDKMYSKLQSIYNSIDEPDGIAGISPRISSIPFEQQMLENKKAGRWNALQGWYEVELNKNPGGTELQTEFLRTLKETGQHDTLINEFMTLKIEGTSIIPMAELVIEAAWNTTRYSVLNTTLTSIPDNIDTNFNIGLGRILMMLQNGNKDEPHTVLEKLRIDAIRQLSATNIKSIQTCHDVMFRFQMLSEVEELTHISLVDSTSPRTNFRTALLQRVDNLGAFPSEKQKLLSIQRAMMDVLNLDIEVWGRSTSWLRTAKIARQCGFAQYAFNAVFRACEGELQDMVDMAYTIENARLLWSEGHHIKAMQNLRTAIESGAFDRISSQQALEAKGRGHSGKQREQNPLAARAHLQLAKWIDHAGQTQSETIIEQYRIAVDLHNKSEKGHYHLGRHYNKLLESEKVKPPAKQAQNYITGEMAKLVIENFLRSMAMGAKYIHQTLPRILTLWLELGNDVKRSIDAAYGNDVNFQRHVEGQRMRVFKTVMAQVKKYADRLPAYAFYTAFSQILARICHPNEAICSSLVDIVAKVVVTHPQQAMWSLLALIKSKKQEARIQRGKECWTKVQENAKKLSEEALRTEIVTLMKQGQRLSDQLLTLSNKDLGKRHGVVSLSNDLGFSHSKSSHCRLAIPVEAMLTASLPTPKEYARAHKAFPKDTITIDTFLDEVLVLNSLIKPKKVTIRGSNGRIYGILCKPKDDLRKDQRLLEFNSMITRLLKRDAQSSKRRLYIKTYAVTPLNEECGLIEWVEGVRPLRDILLDIYKQRNVRTDYAAIKEVLDSITANREEVDRFENEVLNGFPPVFHAWFTDMFPEPSAWFEARLRYTRSCAVMSMVGHVLGLGDRHGENILFQGENGGTLHVDFNCLFDKGLTFEKPERVPFRLTHNMVDAFGVYGYEGPFRKSCELSLGILRQHEHALMTILETFVHDPTTDFIGKKRKANPIVPDTPEGVLEAIRSKVRGLIAGESVPLSVEGHVQLLIQEATDTYNLASMYIGWCAFL